MPVRRQSRPPDPVYAHLIKPSLPLPQDKRGPRIYELSRLQCRYPVVSGEERGEHFFCGKPQHPNSAYCAEHKALCEGRTRGAGALTTWAR